MKYFKIDKIVDENWPFFNNHATPSTQIPDHILKPRGMTPENFVNKANDLFDEYNIKVPNDYPKNTIRTQKLYGEVNFICMDEFANCIISCIYIKEKFGINVSKIIKDDLINNNSRSGILHADSMAAIALFFLNKSREVIIPNKMKYERTADLIINGLKCEVKVVDHSDWTKDINMQTGETKKYILSENICYDIGQFIGKCDIGHKGIKQSDLIFADLSRKTIGLIENITKTNNGFPNLQKYRIIYFAKIINNFSSFYIDFDPNLWEFIKTTKKEYQYSIPWKKPKS